MRYATRGNGGHRNEGDGGGERLEPQRPRCRKRRWIPGAGRVVTLVLAVLFLTAGGTALTSRPALAQKKVKDSRLRSRTSTENNRRLTEIGMKMWELDELLRQAEGLVTLVERALSVTDIKDAVDVFVAGGDVLGYASDDIEMLYDEVFVAYDLPADFDDYFEGSTDVLLDTYSNLLLAINEQMETVPWSESTIEGLKLQIEGQADTQMKALQMQSAVELFKAEELMLLRQALAIQTNAQALVGAYESNKQAIEVGVTSRFIRGE